MLASALAAPCYIVIKPLRIAAISELAMMCRGEVPIEGLRREHTQENAYSGRCFSQDKHWHTPISTSLLVSRIHVAHRRIQAVSEPMKPQDKFDNGCQKLRAG